MRSQLPEMRQLIFRETTTIGVRWHELSSECLPSEKLTVRLPQGEVQVKRCHIGEETRCYPEYASIRALARQSGVDFFELFQAARAAAATLQ